MKLPSMIAYYPRSGLGGRRSAQAEVQMNQAKVKALRQAQDWRGRRQETGVSSKKKGRSSKRKGREKDSRREELWIV